MSQHRRYLFCQLGLVVALVLCYNSRRHRNCLTRSALLLPKYSPWQRLLFYGDEQSFVVMTGMTRVAFEALEQAVFSRCRLRRKRKGSEGFGRPLLIDEKGQLALFLFYLGSKMGNKHLCMIFGVTPSSCSRIVNKLLFLTTRRLKRNEHAAITFPSEEKMEYFSHLINLREPRITEVIGFMDGLSIPCECSSDPVIQNAFYNGYHSDTMVNNVFAFGPDGKIFLACINFPGSWHDSSLTMDIIQFLRVNLKGRKICVDQGFPRGGEAFDILVGPYSEKVAKKLSPILKKHLLELANIYTSLRQASEWGMRALQGTFPRLKSRLPSDGRKRHLIILSIVLLHNFRTSFVGLNQIATVFNPEYQQYQNLDTYDRIRRYYFNGEDLSA